jgi:hypothetical protein
MQTPFAPLVLYLFLQGESIMLQRSWIALSLACGLVAAGTWAVHHDVPAAIGQESKAAPKAAAKDSAKRRVRLPPYYAKVVSAEQREEIYSLQSDYEDQIDALEAQLEQLIDERNAKIREVLTPEQRQEVDDLAAAAQERRKNKKSASSAPAESETSGEAAPAEAAPASKKKPAKPATKD